MDDTQSDDLISQDDIDLLLGGMDDFGETSQGDGDASSDDDDDDVETLVTQDEIDLIRVFLKYDEKENSIIHGLKSVSTPGRRV